jgi:predicted GIY-YIG superfamily endonuclease
MNSEIIIKGGRNIMLKEGTKVAEIYSKLVEMGLKEKYDFGGIYCIKIEDRIVYIGKSVNMLERIAQHEFEMKYAQGKLSNKYKVLREAGCRGYLIKFDVMYYTTRKRPEAVMKDIGKKEGVLIRKHKPILNY